MSTPLKTSETSAFPSAQRSASASRDRREPRKNRESGLFQIERVEIRVRRAGSPGRAGTRTEHPPLLLTRARLVAVAAAAVAAAAAAKRGPVPPGSNLSTV